MAQVGEAATIFAHGFGELLNKAKLDVQRGRGSLRLSTRQCFCFIYRASIHLVQASPSCYSAEICPYYPTCTQSKGTWKIQSVILIENPPFSGQHVYATHDDST